MQRASRKRDDVGRNFEQDVLKQNSLKNELSELLFPYLLYVALQLRFTVFFFFFLFFPLFFLVVLSQYLKSNRYKIYFSW